MVVHIRDPQMLATGYANVHGRGILATVMIGDGASDMMGDLRVATRSAGPPSKTDTRPFMGFHND